MGWGVLGPWVGSLWAFVLVVGMRPAPATDIVAFERACVLPVKQALEARLAAVTGARWWEERDLLRTYLRLVEVEHLDVDEGAHHDDAVVRLARERLEQALSAGVEAGSAHRIFTGDLAGAYPPITLADVFADRPEALAWLSSRRPEAPARVDGLCTARGRGDVLRHLAVRGREVLHEAWVLSLPEETAAGISFEALAAAHDAACAAQWRRWLADVAVRSPAGARDAVALYTTLSRPGGPYDRILRLVEDHTAASERAGDALLAAVRGEVGRRPPARVGASLGIDLEVVELLARPRPAPAGLAGILAFAIPAAGSVTPTPLARYRILLDVLRGRIAKELEARGPGLDPRWLDEVLGETRREAMALVDALDEDARAVLRPLIEDPLTRRRR